MAAKLWLVGELFRRGYSRRQVWQLLRFIDWIIALPEELEDRFWTEVITLSKEKHMPYVTSLERLSLKKGIKQGHEEGLLDAIGRALEVRFGEEGLALVAEVRELHDEALLLQIHDALLRGWPLEMVRKIWCPG
jgi:hypothetical protein